MLLNVGRRGSVGDVILGWTAVVITVIIIARVSMAQEGTTPYCSDLKRVADLAATNERFASISSLKPREGNFIESSIVLAGWSDCTVYGERTFTCDSQPFGTAEKAEHAQMRVGWEVLTCLGPTWVEAKSRSSAGFMVLQHTGYPISVTLSLDQTEHNQYVVRLILFGRSN